MINWYSQKVEIVFVGDFYLSLIISVASYGVVIYKYKRFDVKLLQKILSARFHLQNWNLIMNYLGGGVREGLTAFRVGRVRRFPLWNFLENISIYKSGV